MTTARITVYIQALGGKYLGPNAYNTNDINLTLTLDKNTEKIPYEYVTGKNDGDVKPTFYYDESSGDAITSFLPILGPKKANPADPFVYYLTPDSATICGTIEADVRQPEMLGTLSAGIPRPGEEEANLIITQSIALNQMQSEYRVVMIVPGLLLEDPPKDKVPKGVSAIFLWVKMMCGCPITTDAEKPYWVDNDFEVSAEIFFKNKTSAPAPLTFYSNNYPSVFAAPVPDPDQVQMANFTAKQKSTGNIGFLTVVY